MLLPPALPAPQLLPLCVIILLIEWPILLHAVVEIDMAVVRLPGEGRKELIARVERVVSLVTMGATSEDVSS